MMKAKECAVPLVAKRERMNLYYALPGADGNNQHQLWV